MFSMNGNYSKTGSHFRGTTFSVLVFVLNVILFIILFNYFYVAYRIILYFNGFLGE